jgi:hypothetical protein
MVALSQETRFLRMPALFSGVEYRLCESKNRVSDGNSQNAKSVHLLDDLGFP